MKQLGFLNSFLILLFCHMSTVSFADSKNAEKQIFPPSCDVFLNDPRISSEQKKYLQEQLQRLEGGEEVGLRGLGGNSFSSRFLLLKVLKEQSLALRIKFRTVDFDILDTQEVVSDIEIIDVDRDFVTVKPVPSARRFQQNRYDENRIVGRNKILLGDVMSVRAL